MTFGIIKLLREVVGGQPLLLGFAVRIRYEFRSWPHPSAPSTRARRPQPGIHFHTDVLHTSERRAPPRRRGKGELCMHQQPKVQGGRGAPRRACMHACKWSSASCMHASACKWSSASCMHAVRSGRCGGRWPSTACRKATAAARRCAACWVSPSSWRSVEEAASSCQVEQFGLSSASPCGAQSGAQSAAPAHAH